MKKYELIKKETKEVNGHVLHRIRALRNFSDVKKGDKGGWVEKEENLSHEGDCWVYNTACQYGNSRRNENAKSYNSSALSMIIVMYMCIDKDVE